MLISIEPLNLNVLESQIEFFYRTFEFQMTRRRKKKEFNDHTRNIRTRPASKQAANAYVLCTIQEIPKLNYRIETRNLKKVKIPCVKKGMKKTEYLRRRERA